MRALGNWAGRALAVICLIAALPAAAHAKWIQGQFTANGKTVTEYHCIPSGSGPHPAVILLHGAGPKEQGYDVMETICGELADAGYYTEFIEFYSQNADVPSGQRGRLKKLFPIWQSEIRSGLEAMGHNPQIDPHRIGIIGYSLGAILALVTGGSAPDKVAAIVDYYGALPNDLESMAAKLPPTLILHGSADNLVPVAHAQRLDKLMTAANRPHEIRIYPNARHGFNFQIPAWYNATDAKDAWERTLNFLARYLGGKPAPKSSAAR